MLECIISFITSAIMYLWNNISILFEDVNYFASGCNEK